MSAEELYLIYATSLLENHNLGVDPWHELPPEEQAAWEAVSVSVEVYKISAVTKATS